MSCLQCGICCTAIPLPFNLKEKYESQERIDDGEILWNHWHVISKEQALALNPRLIEGREKLTYYECDLYNKENKACALHGTNKKPQTCIDFPFHKDIKLSENITMSESCGYLSTNETGKVL